MKDIVTITDVYEFTNNRILLTQNQHHVPGLQTFGHHFTYNAAKAIAWHFHKGLFEFTVPVKGKYYYSTEDDDYEISAGHVFFSYPNEIHSTASYPIAPGEFYWFQIDVNAIQELLFLSPQASQELIQKLKNIPSHIIKLNARKSTPVIAHAFEYALKWDNPFYVASLLQVFLHMCINSHNELDNTVSPDIKRVLNYISEHIENAFTMEELASISNLCCSQFKQKFKKETGLSPLYYINQQKIEYSKKLLLTDMTVTDIAMLLNFTSSSYFSTVFKKYTLYTPLEYRKIHIDPS